MSDIRVTMTQDQLQQLFWWAADHHVTQGDPDPMFGVLYDILSNKVTAMTRRAEYEHKFNT